MRVGRGRAAKGEDWVAKSCRLNLQPRRLDFDRTTTSATDSVRGHENQKLYTKCCLITPPPVRTPGVGHPLIGGGVIKFSFSV